tara:strand:+ start:12145 stop:12465 length:321 start_codon:yes stop_codon:yes gene_type:complete
MIITTTDNIEGRRITEYMGSVSGAAVVGASVFKDFLKNAVAIIHSQSGVFEADVDSLHKAAEKTIAEKATAMGADAVVGVDFDYQVLGDSRPMILLSVNGTAVKLE